MKKESQRPFSLSELISKILPRKRFNIKILKYFIPQLLQFCNNCNDYKTTSTALAAQKSVPATFAAGTLFVLG